MEHQLPYEITQWNLPPNTGEQFTYPGGMRG